MDYHRMQLPPGFEVIDAPFISHRYSRFEITQDSERTGGWCVVRDAHMSDDFEPVFIVVTFHDRLADACAFINCLTNPHIRLPD